MKRLSLLLFLAFSLLYRCFCGIDRRNRTYAACRQITAGAGSPSPLLSSSLCPPASGPTWNFWLPTRCADAAARTADELVAATYVAAQLRAYGISPAGDNGGYLQRATLLQPKFTAPPQLTFAKSGTGGEKVTLELRQRVRGPLSRASPVLRPVARDQC